MLKASTRPVPERKVPAKVPQGVHYSCVHKMLYQDKVSILKKAARIIAFLCNALWLEQNSKDDYEFVQFLIMR